MRKYRKIPLGYRKELIDTNTQLIRLAYYPSDKIIRVTAHKIFKTNMYSNRIISDEAFSSFKGLDADALGQFNQISKYRMHKVFGNVGVAIPNYVMYTTLNSLSKDQGRFLRILKKIKIFPERLECNIFINNIN